MKGYTFIELIGVILLSSILGCTAMVGHRYVQTVTFHSKVKEVETGIVFARQAAIRTGRYYNVYCTSEKIYIRCGVEPALYKIQLGSGMKVDKESTGKHIMFIGSMAPSKAGTIILVHEGLRRRARITVRIATGKTTVYFESC